MYQILIEAAGLRQIGRIQPEWNARFLADLDRTLRTVGLERTVSDGDLILASDVGERLVEPEQCVDAVRAVDRLLAGTAEQLADYTIVVDYRPLGDPATCAVTIERYLLHARASARIYLTAAAAAAVDPFVEATPSGALAAIVRFRSARRVSAPAYTRAMSEDGAIRRIHDAWHNGGMDRHVWVHGGPTVAAVVRAALEARDHTVTLRVMRDDAVETVLSRLLALIPPRYVRTSDDEGDQALRTLHSIHERLSQPAAPALTGRYLRGEARMVAAAAIDYAVRDVGPLVIALTDVDETVTDVVRTIDELCDRIGPRVRLVVGAVVERPAGGQWSERWTDLSVIDAEEDARLAAYWWGAAGERCGDESTCDDPAAAGAALLRALPANHRLALAYIAAARGLLIGEAMDELLDRSAISRAERSRIVQDLLQLGLIDDATLWTCHPIVRDLEILPAAGEAAAAVRSDTAACLMERIATRRLRMTAAVWRVVEPGLAEARRHPVWHRSVHDLAAAGSFDEFDALVRYHTDAGPVFRIGALSARLRLYLRDSRGPAVCSEMAEELASLVAVADAPAEVQSDALVSLSEFGLAKRDYPGALERVKGALMIRQEMDLDLRPEQLLLARIMLAQRRIGDAGQYLAFAGEEGGDLPARLIATVLEAIRHMIVGNLTRAYRELATVEGELLATGYTEWLTLAWFATARILFEFGDYEPAADRMAALASYAEASGMVEAWRVAYAWRLRSQLHAGDDPEQIRDGLAALGESAETTLFAAESYARESRFDVANALLDRASQLELANDRWPRIGVCWDNGFAAVEDLVMSSREGATELLRVIDAYRAWSLAQIGRHDEAISVFYSLTRGPEGVTEDPYTGIYNFLYADILPSERSSERDDRVTVLGRAVKIVQERTSRIDDYRDKLRFLGKNSWNRQVMEAARRHNLA